MTNNVNDRQRGSVLAGAIEHTLWFELGAPVTGEALG
jgi:hypothetical protein